MKYSIFALFRDPISFDQKTKRKPVFEVVHFLEDNDRTEAALDV